MTSSGLRTDVKRRDIHHVSAELRDIQDLHVAKPGKGSANARQKRTNGNEAVAEETCPSLLNREILDGRVDTHGLQACRLKYEKCERFIPTSLRLSDTRCQPNVAAVDYRFIGILDCRIRRPVKGAGEFQRFAGSNGVRVRHPRPLDRLEDGEVHRQGGAHW